MTTRRALLLPLAAASLAGLLIGISMNDAQSASTNELEIPTQRCAASMTDWMEQTYWPAKEVLLGDQIYSRDRLWNLNHSQGNRVADLGLALATAQLNLAAGAEAAGEIVDALFEADQWLLDAHEENRRSQEDAESLTQLSQALTDFNHWAARSADCALNH